MLTKDGGFVLSPSDLTANASCEFAWLRGVDVKLERLADVQHKADAMLERAAVLGDVHESRVLEGLRAQHGAGVVELDRPDPYTPAILVESHARTIDHLKQGVDVLFQGTLFDGRFGGMADFMVRQTDGTYQVQDAKLARSAKVPALLQIAAYADLLDGEGVPRSRLGVLVLGDQSVSEHDLNDIIPVYRHRRAQLEDLLHRHLAQSEPVPWESPDVSVCGACDWCLDEIGHHRDVLLVAGLGRPQRTKLRASGIETIEQLAESTHPVAGLGSGTLENLRLQATLQLVSKPDGSEITTCLLNGGRAISLLPAPSDGDVFFDFEGDPLWTDDGTDWGLEYLWGVIEPDGEDGVFRKWWAHDRVQEKAALIDFLDYVVARRQMHPGMHVYHYAPYEVTALKRLVARHATHEDKLDDLLRANVFIDLYATVRRGIRVGTRSYSIKKLEPLYMGDQLRGELDNAADSIAEYQRFCDQVLAEPDAAEATLEGIADYNRYDCLSTWRLRDWLRSQVRSGATVTTPDSEAFGDLPATERIDELAPLVDALLAHVPDVARHERSNDQQAMAMLAASLGYHRRERKSFWWSYFERLVADVDEWPEPRDCFVVEEVELVDDWHRKQGDTLEKRRLRLYGRLDPATRIDGKSEYRLIYDEFPPGVVPDDPRGRCLGGSTKIEAIENIDEHRDALTVLESCKTLKRVVVATGWSELPMGLCVSGVIGTTSIDEALQALAREVLGLAPGMPMRAALDLLRRVPPRLDGGGLTGIEAAGSSEHALLDSVRRLDRSYLAVQGPPGTGKTYVGSRVVKQLVESGWKVGVVAQSHSVVEHFLRATIKAGLAPARVAKQKSAKEEPWLSPTDAKLRAFIAESGGCLVGGTPWDMTNRNRVQEEQLDLLVIDEAGQFSLANTLAAASSAQRVMLLGDPQQLPQVSQGTHPEPVDESALSWVANGQATMPPTHGYFLERTRRMHSALTEVDSNLSYEGRLHSQVDATDSRELTGMEPGLHPAPVTHHGNGVQSQEEADEVVRIVRMIAGETWRESVAAVPRPTSPADVLVVAPYNAQVSLIRATLDAAGLTDTRVGTVDKFQGQEAPVVIVSMTASSAADAPRGLDFLLNRNRLNVAISRGQWAAHVVHSPALADTMPATPHGIAELGAFLRTTTPMQDPGRYLSTSPVSSRS